MKKSLFILLISIGIMSSAAAKELTLGDPVKMDAIQPITAVLEQPTEFNGKEVTIKGTITKVCKKRGCWADFTSNDKRLRVKVADGEIEIPLHTIGKEAYATGVLSSTTLNKEQTIAHLEHMAKDAEESFNPSSVKKGMTLYQLKSNAVKIIL